VLPSDVKNKKRAKEKKPDALLLLVHHSCIEEGGGRGIVLRHCGCVEREGVVCCHHTQCRHQARGDRGWYDISYEKRIIKKHTIVVGTTAAGSDAHTIEGNMRAANRTCKH